MIEVKNLVFGYGKKKNFHKIINNVSFTINDGEFVAIAGENGAGKSTLSKLISGLIKPVEGSVTINSLDTKKQRTASLQDKLVFCSRIRTGSFAATL